MKAILVKYHGPTNTKSARLSVRAEGTKVKFVSRDYQLDVREQADRLADEYARSHEWAGKLVSGTLPDGNIAYCFART